MALIDIVCAADHLHEIHRSIHDWPVTPACPTCGAPTVQIHLPTPLRASVDPVVVYRHPDGSFRFPGDANGISAANYSRQGLERIELRSAADVRRFEKVMNAREYSRMARAVERKQQMREERESATRSELRRLMPNMTEFGRAVARAAQGRNDAKPRERVKDPNFHVQCYSYDKSNREESRDERGRRRRD